MSGMDDSVPRNGNSTHRTSATRRWAAPVLAVAAVLLVVAAGAVASRDDDTKVVLNLPAELVAASTPIQVTLTG